MRKQPSSAFNAPSVKQQFSLRIKLPQLQAGFALVCICQVTHLVLAAAGIQHAIVCIGVDSQGTTWNVNAAEEVFSAHCQLLLANTHNASGNCKPVSHYLREAIKIGQVFI